mgnify:CR=1 FL=1
MIKLFEGKQPQLGRNVYVSENAIVIGDVTLGDEVNIWFGAVLRGDMHYIKIGNRTNIQDNSVVHVTTGVSPTNIGNGVTVGHGAIIHGCTIEDDCMIGMGAIIMDDALIGSGSLVGAGALVPPKIIIPPNSLVIGMPGKVVREINNEEHSMILERPQEYIDLAIMLANDRKKNQALRKKSKNAANKHLFNNKKTLKEFEKFLEEAHRTAQKGKKGLGERRALASIRARVRAAATPSTPNSAVYAGSRASAAAWHAGAIRTGVASNSGGTPGLASAFAVAAAGTASASAAAITVGQALPLAASSKISSRSGANSEPAADADLSAVRPTLAGQTRSRGAATCKKRCCCRCSSLTRPPSSSSTTAAKTMDTPRHDGASRFCWLTAAALSSFSSS